MAGFVIQTVKDQKTLDEGLAILARIFAHNILDEISKNNSSRKEALNVRVA